MIEPLSLVSAVDGVLDSISYPHVVSMALLAFVVSAGVGLLYRLVMDAPVPLHVPLIVGVGVVGLWMNTASTIVQFVERSAAEEPLLFENMASNSVAIAASGVTAIGGARFGDGLAPNVRALTGATETESPVHTIVRTVGRFISVQVPDADHIEDIDGYEPIDLETKEDVAGVEFLFPRGLTTDDLHRRVVDRLRSDHGIGHVDLELDQEGNVTYLAVGRRASGIGPTLPPRRGAIGLRSTPAPEASPGDRVRVWTTSEGGAERVAKAELRATSEDVATVVMDVDRIEEIDQSRRFELVTLQAEKQPALEFAALLRTANETMESVAVEDGSILDGTPVGALKLPVLAIRSSAGGMDVVPSGQHVCRRGDTVYAIGRHDELRKLRSAGGTSESTSSAGGAVPDGSVRADRDGASSHYCGQRSILERLRGKL